MWCEGEKVYNKQQNAIIKISSLFSKFDDETLVWVFRLGKSISITENFIQLKTLAKKIPLNEVKIKFLEPKKSFSSLRTN